MCSLFYVSNSFIILCLLMFISTLELNDLNSVAGSNDLNLVVISDNFIISSFFFFSYTGLLAI